MGFEGVCVNDFVLLRKIRLTFKETLKHLALWVKCVGKCLIGIIKKVSISPRHFSNIDLNYIFRILN